MNKTEKLICILLAGVLAWYVFDSMSQKGKKAEENATAVAALTNATAAAATPASAAVVPEKPVVAEKKLEPAKPSEPEALVKLENDEVRLELSSWGAVVKKATLKKYARDCGEVSEKNPAVEMDFSAAPLGELTGVEGLVRNASYRVVSSASNEVVFANDFAERRIALDKDYRIVLKEKFLKGGASCALPSASRR